jgi:RNA polymerase sigma-70 factor (ECF subfamily)
VAAAESRIASRVELEAAIRALSPTDMIKIRRIAELRAAGLRVMDWSDLLQEAVVRALSGSRAWPKDIPLIAFLAQTMRSIANEAWVGAERSGTVDANLAHMQDTVPDPERCALAADTLRHVYSLFDDDPDATAVLNGVARGIPPTEIQRAAQMTEHRYTAAQKRIRRRLASTPFQSI